MDPNIMRLQKEAEERVRQTQERNRRLIAEMPELSVSPPVRYYGRQRPDYLSERASAQLENDPVSPSSERFYKPGDTSFHAERPSQHTDRDNITFRKQAAATADRVDRADTAHSPTAETSQRHIPIRYGRYDRRHDHHDHHDRHDRHERYDKHEHAHKLDRSDKKSGLGLLKLLDNFDHEELLILFLIFLLAQEEDSFPLIIALVYLLL